VFVRLFAGFVLGAALTALGLWMAPAGSSVAPPVADAPVGTVPDEPVWISAGEARFGNSVIVGRDLTQEGDRIRFEYDLESLASGHDFVSDHDVVTAAPSVFRANLASGDAVDGELLGGSSRSVSFVVPDGVTVEDITSLHLSEWRVRVPIDIEITLPSEQGASEVLPDGSIITVDTILEQTNGTIIQFDYEIPPDAWPEPRRIFGPTPDFAGAGPGWRLASANMGLTRGFQLTWAGPTAPDELAIRVRTAPWHQVASDIEVPLPQKEG
jgi:hypothetical protein